MVLCEPVEGNELVSVGDVGGPDPVEVEDHGVLVLEVRRHLGLARLGRRVQRYRLGQLRRRVRVCNQGYSECCMVIGKTQTNSLDLIYDLHVRTRIRTWKDVLDSFGFLCDDPLFLLDAVGVHDSQAL